MPKPRFLRAVLLAAASVLAPPAAHATVVKVLAAGSPEVWQTAALAAYSALAGTGAGHFTVTGTCFGGNCAQLFDPRTSMAPLEGGKLWVVWNSAMTDVWAYFSIDSIAGNRAYFAQPRSTLQISPLTETGVPAGQTNLISSNLWGVDSVVLPAAVYTALNNVSVTAAFTDVRPEDAKFATCRALNQLNSVTYSGLGYGTGTTCTTVVGTSILSAFSSDSVTPVVFHISGTDPITGHPIPAFTTLDVGASPILFIANRTNPSGLGYPTPSAAAITNVTVPEAQALWNGTLCDTNSFVGGPLTSVPVHVMQRDPVSGDMNTTEFTTFRCGAAIGPCLITGLANVYNSQEKGVNPSNPNNNPLNLACTLGGGTRQRAIGNGEMAGTAIHNTTDSIGYTFWSFANVAPVAGSSNYGYLTLNGVDPIQTAYTNGMLPTCAPPCPATPGTSFPNLRNGTYPAWSLLRAITDASGVNRTNTAALVNAIPPYVNSTVPDFVPFYPVGGDPGMVWIRSHYGTGASNPTPDHGRDMGGCIEVASSTVINCHQ